MARYCIDLFAGCGGLSLGLEEAGFTPILVNEISDEARESYLINRQEYPHFVKHTVDDPENPWIWKDVKELRKYLASDFHSFADQTTSRFGIDLKAGELDLLVGGPPCQGYSGIGHRRSYAVDKKEIPSNHLFQDMIFTISKLKPKMFLFENVRGLLSARWDKDSEKGSIWLDIRNEFQAHFGEDYYMGWHLVRASEYGVPQNRPRVLLVGLRKDLGWNPESDDLDQENLLFHCNDHRAGGLLPQPQETPPSLEELLGDLIDPNYTSGQTTSTNTYQHPAKKSRSKEKLTAQQKLRLKKDKKSSAKANDILTEQEYSKHSANIIEKFTYMIQNEGQIPEKFKTKKFAQRVLPRVWKDGQPSITATSLPDDYVHFEQPRILTVREWARLQMFPDWYQFAGKRTTGGTRRAGNPLENNFEREVPKYTQIGNAVPVRMAYYVGQHFLEILNAVEDGSCETESMIEA